MYKKLTTEDITYERLHEVLDYNKKTGIFVWLISRKGVKAGTVAGSKQKGYLHIRIDWKLYKAHRLAWLYVYGYFPEHGLDHKDRIKHHNWIKNLREVSAQCNIRNTGNHATNISGVKGVHFHKAAQKWCAEIMVNKKSYYLGNYNSFDNAVCARLAGEQCLNWSNCDSSSPAYQYVQKMIGIN